MMAWALSLLVGFGVSCDFLEERDASYSVTQFNAKKGAAGTYGSSYSDVATSIFQTSDGGYMVGGYTWAFISLTSEPTDYWIMKLDTDQEIIWSKIYGSTGREYAYSVKETSDDGYIVAGHSRKKLYGDLDYGGNYWDFWILKLDQGGNILWNKTFGGPGYEKANAILETIDGGYLVAGFATSYGPGGMDSGVIFRESKKNVWVLKLDSEGNQVWEYLAGGMGEDGALAACETPDGKYMISGFDSSVDKGNYDFLVLRLDASGNEEWYKTYGGVHAENAYAIKEAPDHGYIVVGDTWSYGNGNTDIWALKLDVSGNQVWQATFGGEKFERAYAVDTTTGDSAYIIAGYTSSFGAGDNDGLILKLDSDGNKLFHQTVGGEGTDFLFSVDETDTGDIIAAGTTNSYGAGQLDLWIVKLSGQGDILP